MDDMILMERNGTQREFPAHKLPIRLLQGWTIVPQVIDDGNDLRS